jgi:hypothetical protein
MHLVVTGASGTFGMAAVATHKIEPRHTCETLVGTPLIATQALIVTQGAPAIEEVLARSACEAISIEITLASGTISMATVPIVEYLANLTAGAIIVGRSTAVETLRVALEALVTGSEV